MQLFFLWDRGSGGLAQNPQESQPGANRVIEVMAKKYEFSPDEIHVKKGERVELKVHSSDEGHGIKLELHPEGNKDRPTPGLVLTIPKTTARTKFLISWRNRRDLRVQMRKVVRNTSRTDEGQTDCRRIKAAAHVRTIETRAKALCGKRQNWLVGHVADLGQVNGTV